MYPLSDSYILKLIFTSVMGRGKTLDNPIELRDRAFRNQIQRATSNVPKSWNSKERIVSSQPLTPQAMKDLAAFVTFLEQRGLRITTVSGYIASAAHFLSFRPEVD